MVLLRLGSCCISHYDFDYLTRFQGRDQSYDRTYILGSFGTGIVLELGAGTQGMFNIGDQVAFEPAIYCQKCSYCKAGKTNLCPEIKYLGTEGQDGLLCRFINHPANFIQKLPAGVSLELGTLTAKVARCIHGYKRSRITKDSKVLIMGTSLIGLLTIIIFKHLGVGTIFVAEMNNYKLKMAREVGADYVIKLTSQYSPEYPEYLKQIIDSVHTGEPDVVADTWGTTSSLDISLNLIKSGGTLLLLNRMTRTIEAKFYHTTLREIDIVGAYSYTHSSFLEGINLLSNQDIPFKKILPIKIPLERALDAFSHGRATKGDNLLILVNSYNEEEKSSSQNTIGQESIASTPNFKSVTEISEPTEAVSPIIESSTSTTTSGKEIKEAASGSIQQTEKLVTPDDKEKLTFTSPPTHDKKKENTYEVVLRPKSADVNENEIWLQSNEDTPEAKEKIAEKKEGLVEKKERMAEKITGTVEKPSGTGGKTKERAEIKESVGEKKEGLIEKKNGMGEKTTGTVVKPAGTADITAGKFEKPAGTADITAGKFEKTAEQADIKEGIAKKKEGTTEKKEGGDEKKEVADEKKEGANEKTVGTAEKKDEPPKRKEGGAEIKERGYEVILTPKGAKENEILLKDKETAHEKKEEKDVKKESGDEKKDTSSDKNKKKKE